MWDVLLCRYIPYPLFLYNASGKSVDLMHRLSLSTTRLSHHRLECNLKIFTEMHLYLNNAVSKLVVLQCLHLIYKQVVRNLYTLKYMLKNLFPFLLKFTIFLKKVYYRSNLNTKALKAFLNSQILHNICLDMSPILLNKK